MMNEFMNAHDISAELGISRSFAYKIIRKLNEELKDKGYFVISGKVPRRYFNFRFYIKPHQTE